MESYKYDIIDMNKLLVIIDCGHGENTPGKRSPDSSLMEWKWNREMGMLIYRRLNEIGIAAHLLVPEDKDISLASRCQRANTIYNNFKKQGYDCLYLSVHVNAAAGSGWHNASGCSVYCYTSGSEKSKRAAKIYTDLSKKMGLTGNRSIPSQGYYTANFYVLKNTNMAAILVEHMFMDNKKDVEYLLSESGKKELLKWHENSILEYINTLS